MFSDQAHLYLDGTLNSKQFRLWFSEIPDLVQEKTRHRNKVTMLVCSIEQPGRGVLGTFWFQ